VGTLSARSAKRGSLEKEGFSDRDVYTIAVLYYCRAPRSGRDNRAIPARFPLPLVRLDALLKGVSRKEFDIVAAWSVCRLGRSLSDVIGLLGELRSRDIDLYLHQQALDTTTPSGRALFCMLGVFSEFERSMIRDRVMAGLDRARSSGKRLGRPRTTPFTVQRIRSHWRRAVVCARRHGC
jgi:hypothetical protein